MAVIQRGILGGFKNKIANVVGSSWKGIAVMKSLPLSVANPNTVAQQAQRGKFANVVAFASAWLTDVIKPLNDRFAQKQSGYNLFIQRNISLFEFSEPTPLNALRIAVGPLTPMAGGAAVADVSLGTVILTYDDNSGDGEALATDLLYVGVFNQDRVTFSSTNGSTRADGTITIDLPNLTQAGDNIRIWAAYANEEGTKVSDTAYVTTVAIA